MRPRTIVAVAGLLFVLGVVAVVAIVGVPGAGHHLETLWVSDTQRDITSNHHVPAAATGGSTPMVYAPVSGRTDTENCALIKLNGTSGTTEWDYPIPAPNCTIHSVADPTLADYDADGTQEVLVATTEQAVHALDPVTGAVEFSHDLTSYGYTAPLVADFVGEDTPEVIVVDVQGAVFVLRPNGSTAWSTNLSASTWAQPAIADFDGDGTAELVVGLGGTGTLHRFEPDGTRAWSDPPTLDGSITWLTTGQADADSAREIVVASATPGVVSLIDGVTGNRTWTRDLGRFAAVHAMGDGDADGVTEIYAVARDGVLRSLAAPTGDVEWTTTLTTADVQMTPPPAMGDLDGDGDPELLAVSNDGIVSLVDPTTGAILDSVRREVPIFTHPRLADLDGDGTVEGLVMYADGRVLALDAA